MYSLILYWALPYGGTREGSDGILLLSEEKVAVCT